MPKLPRFETERAAAAFWDTHSVLDYNEDKMKVHRWDDIKKRKLSPEKIQQIRSQVEQEILQMNLQAVRELAGKTQVDVAEATGMSQSEVSRAERRDDHLLSTLRRYIEALGGELEITAHFGDKSVKLRGV